MSFPRTDVRRLRTLLITVCLVVSVAAAQPVRPAAPPSTLPNAADSVKFLVIGDSGTGGASQYQVAVKTRTRLRFPSPSRSAR